MRSPQLKHITRKSVNSDFIPAPVRTASIVGDQLRVDTESKFQQLDLYWNGQFNQNGRSATLIAVGSGPTNFATDQQHRFGLGELRERMRSFQYSDGTVRPIPRCTINVAYGITTTTGATPSTTVANLKLSYTPGET